MDMTVDNCRMVSLNAELQQVVNNFVRETVVNNDIPWYFMKNALVGALAWVRDEENTEIAQAQAVMQQALASQQSGVIATLDDDGDGEQVEEG